MFYDFTATPYAHDNVYARQPAFNPAFQRIGKFELFQCLEQRIQADSFYPLLEIRV